MTQKPTGARIPNLRAQSVRDCLACIVNMNTPRTYKEAADLAAEGLEYMDKLDEQNAALLEALKSVTQYWSNGKSFNPRKMDALVAAAKQAIAQAEGGA